MLSLPAKAGQLLPSTLWIRALELGMVLILSQACQSIYITVVTGELISVCVCYAVREETISIITCTL